MNFNQAMELVEERFPFPEPQHFHNRRTAWLLETSGLGERLRERPRVAVAGSCGKASTARFLAFILATGSRVALATKPPLRETPQGNLERYQIVDQRGAHWLDGDLFAAFATELEPYVTRLQQERPDLGPPAPYDLRAWIVGRLSCEAGIDWTVQEANIGLLDDPLGAFPPPRLTMLTPIGEEHASMLVAPEEFLGLGAAAGPVWHKAGGLACAPVVLSRQRLDLEPAILELAARRGAGPVLRWGQDYGVAGAVDVSLAGTAGSIFLGRQEPFEVRTSVLGGFQLENAAQAAAAATQLWGPVFPEVAVEAIQGGIFKADSPGRLQILRQADPVVIYTIGGGVAKLQGAIEAIEEIHTAGTRWIVCASFLGRSYGLRSAVETLAARPRLDGMVITADTSDPRSLDADPEEVASWVRELRPDLPLWVERDVALAVALARGQVTGPGDLVLLVGDGLGHRLADLSL